MNGLGYYNSPIGVLKIVSANNSIVEVSFVDKVLEEESNLLIEQCKRELQEYFQGERKVFDVKIQCEKGTEFQKKVWNALNSIPYGEQVSYKYIANKIQNDKATRAVGGANNKNPISIIIPCHRVVGVNGKLVGYAEGVDKKKFLLDLEKKYRDGSL